MGCTPESETIRKLKQLILDYRFFGETRCVIQEAVEKITELGKAIEPVAHWYNRDTILATVIDIVADLQKDRKAVLGQIEHNRITKEQITAIRKKILAFQTANDNTLEQILDDLKLIKIYSC